MEQTKIFWGTKSFQGTSEDFPFQKKVHIHTYKWQSLLKLFPNLVQYNVSTVCTVHCSVKWLGILNSSNFFLREKFVTELYLKKENKKAFAQAESKVRVHCTVFSVPTNVKASILLHIWNDKSRYNLWNLGLFWVGRKN